MSPRLALNWLRGRTVGFKLTATLVGVVIFTAFVLSFFLGQLAKGYLLDHSRHHLNKELQELTTELNGAGAEAVLAALDERVRSLARELEPHCVFALDGGGRPLKVWERSDWLPETAILHGLAGEGQGWMRVRLAGEAGLLVFRSLPQGVVVGLIARAEDLLGPTMANLRKSTWLVTLILAAVVAVFAVWLARVELSLPLMRLTEEGERVAAGDLTPPTPLTGREDELGRLSRVLHSMTLTARQMVAEAKASQARFQQLFMDSRDAAFIIGRDGRVEDMNPAGLKMFGHEGGQDLTGLASTEDLFANQEERRGYLRALREQGFVHDFPLTLARRDGSTFDALVTATLRGEGEARFGLVRDVTQAARAQRELAESEERHRRLVENAPDIIYRWSIPGNSFDYISPAVEAVTGFAPGEIVHSTEMIWNVVHPEWRKEVARRWQKVLGGLAPAASEHEFKIVARDGSVRWLRERSLLVRDEGGRPVALEGIATDVTERKLARQALEQGRLMVEATLQGLPAAVMVVDHEHRVVHWNRAMEKLTRVPASEVVGTDRQWHPFYNHPRPVLADLILDDDHEGIERLYGHLSLKRSTLISGGLECEAHFPSLAGRERYIYFLAAPVTDGEGRVIRAVETLVDLTDKRRLEEELRRLTVTDDLTGLYNQRFFYATLTREMEGAARYDLPLCLIMADLDEFKSFNDRFGHVEGDRALAACGQALRNLVRTTDLACRYGGEEFSVLLPRTGVEEALLVAERVRAGLAQLGFTPASVQGEPLRGLVTASVGLACFQPGLAAEELVRRADQAMYEAKTRGKNRVVLYLGEGRMKEFC